MLIKREKAFTLAELLIAVSIFALIAITVFSTFNTGIKAWRRSTEYAILSKDARLTLERMSRDLRNALRFSGLQFIGESASLSIPGLISISEESDPSASGSQLQIGRIIYFLDEADDSLQMRRQTYAEAINAIDTQPKVLASSVIDLSLRYCHYDEETGEYIWEESYNQLDKFPLEVKIALTLKHPTSEERTTLTRTVLMPID